jgi:hypothetical protein
VKLEPTLRVLAGVVVLSSLALGSFVSPYWFLLTAFAGANLLQSGFTGWCPVIPVLRRLGATPATYSDEARSIPNVRLEGQS